MPYPNGLPPMLGDLAMGITPITVSIGALVGTGGAIALLRQHRHWKKLQQPNHFDRVCNACLDLLHVAKENRKFTRKHLDEDWTPEVKEKFRIAAVNNIKHGWSFHPSWDRLPWGHTTGQIKMLIDDDGRMYGATFLQPRETSPAF